MTASTLLDPHPVTSAVLRPDDPSAAGTPLVDALRRPSGSEPGEVGSSSSPGPTERFLAFALPTMTFLIAGWNMAMVHGLLPGDSLARVAQASATISSRDPHLEAIGFVWAPFPTLFEIPLVWLGRWFPELVTQGMASVIVSAVLMGSMCCIVHRWLAEVGVQRWTRAALTALLAVHPLILLHGANGLSDACMLFFLVVAARRLALWWERDHLLDLVMAGAACAMAYLTRYEAAASIILLIAAVSAREWQRAADESPPIRTRRTLTIGLVAGLPPVFAATLWAVSSWAIIGQPFAQLSSEYGNSTQFKTATASIVEMAGAASGLRRGVFFVEQMVGLSSITIVAVVLLAWFGTVGGPRISAAFIMVGGPLAFHIASGIAGSTFAWARYAIAVVPLGALLLGPLLVSIGTNRSALPAWVPRATVVGLAAAAVLASLVPLHSAALGTKEETWQFSAFPAPFHTDKFADRRSLIGWGATIAHDIERLRPGHGDVLTDSANTFSVVLAAHDQRDFVITSDRDFEQTAADPSGAGVRYLLVVDSHSGLYDSVESAHPGLFDTGGGISHVIREWGTGAADSFHVRLFAVDHPAARR